MASRKGGTTFYDEDDLYDDFDDDHDSEDESIEQVSQRAPVAPQSSFACSLCPQPGGRGRAPHRPQAAASQPAGDTKAKGFDFSTPSPDDIAASARRGNQAVPANAAPKYEPPSNKRAIKASKAAESKVPGSSIQGGDLGHSGGQLGPTPVGTTYQDPRQYTPSPALLRALAKCNTAKPPLHVVVLGHVDAGKSTLMGRLLHDLGFVDAAAARKNLQEATKIGKASFAWAWVLDERPEERQRGVTVDISMRRFSTTRFEVTLLDAPGHRDFIPHMITGAAQADAALLVVDGSRGGFEAGFAEASQGANSSGGQTREHIQLARSLGIRQVAVVITKLDTCDFSEDRFLHIKATLGRFLVACGFKDTVQWLPASPVLGENITQAPRDPRLAAWWKGGRTVAAAIDEFEVVTRSAEVPLRIIVTEVCAGRGGADAVLVGKVESGAVLRNDRVLLMPAAHEVTVKSLHVNGVAQDLALAGHSVDVGVGGTDPAAVAVGSVLCDPSFPVRVASSLQVRILMVGMERPLIPGVTLMAHVHSGSVTCKLSKFIELLDSRSGKVVKVRPRLLIKDQAATVETVLDQALCVATAADCRALSRIVFRSGGVTIAVGTVQALL